MGQRGPQPMPDESKRLAGKAGSPASEETECGGVAGAPTRPDLSDDIAKEAWDILCKELSDMEVLATSYQTLMKLFCETKSLWVQAMTSLRDGGGVLVGPKGGAYMNPWANLETMYAKRLESYLSSMGLSPASRAGVSKIPRAETNEGKSRFFGRVVG